MTGIEQQPVHRRVTPAAIPRWLVQGWRQFRASWPPSLLFAAIFGAVGLAGAWLSLYLGMALAFRRGTYFVNAIVASVRAVFGNVPTMALWGAVIAGLMFLALTVAWPLFPVALPVLAYASNAAYREVFGPDPRPG